MQAVTPWLQVFMNITLSVYLPCMIITGQIKRLNAITALDTARQQRKGATQSFMEKGCGERNVDSGLWVQLEVAA